jgi:23S rRNA pseudouridine1911/1915/1917 synthase
LQRWIKDGLVTVDGAHFKSSDTVRGGERIELRPVADAASEDQPQDIALDILYEDEYLIVINKPPGLVVHPAVGNRDGTLLNALLYRIPGLATLPRAGIVHRLDKDTSGALVIAKNLVSHQALVRQLAARSVRREYLALVWGTIDRSGKVNEPVGRHPADRKRMAVVRSGRESLTFYSPYRHYPGLTLLKLRLETGRTHQIRVHMTYIRHPVIGDSAYGGRRKQVSGIPAEYREKLLNFERQALHAEQLSLTHPVSGQDMSWHASLPQDFAALLEALEPFADQNPQARAR